MTPEDIESMLVTLIQQGDLHASIDQIRGVVVLGDGMSSAGTRSRNVGTQKSRALAKWADALVHVSNNLVAPVI